MYMLWIYICIEKEEIQDEVEHNGNYGSYLLASLLFDALFKGSKSRLSSLTTIGKISNSILKQQSIKAYKFKHFTGTFIESWKGTSRKTLTGSEQGRQIQRQISFEHKWGQVRSTPEKYSRRCCYGLGPKARSDPLGNNIHLVKENIFRVKRLWWKTWCLATPYQIKVIWKRQFSWSMLSQKRFEFSSYYWIGLLCQ